MAGRYPGVLDDVGNKRGTPGGFIVSRVLRELIHGPLANGSEVILELPQFSTFLLLGSVVVGPGGFLRFRVGNDVPFPGGAAVIALNNLLVRQRPFEGFNVSIWPERCELQTLAHTHRANAASVLLCDRHIPIFTALLNDGFGAVRDAIGGFLPHLLS